LDAKEHDNEYEERTIDLNLEKRVNNFICPPEALNADDFAKDCIPLIEKEGANLYYDPFHDKHEIDCFMYLCVDSHENEFADHLVKEQVDVPSFFFLDDIADVVELSLYDKYDDDYDVEFLEQSSECSLLENVHFQQCNESNQPTYHSYKEENEEGFESSEITLPLCFSSFELLKKNVYNVPNQKSLRHDVEYEESSGIANEAHLLLCFSSFELLKVNHEITEEAVKFDCIHSDIVLHEKIVISEEDQQPSHTFNDPFVYYMESCFSSDLQPVISYQLGNKYDGKSTLVLYMDLFPLGVSFQPV
jgi:hypothetical protein